MPQKSQQKKSVLSIILLFLSGLFIRIRSDMNSKRKKGKKVFAYYLRALFAYYLQASEFADEI